MGFPSTPTSLYINGFPEKDEKLTKNTDGSVSVSAVINDPDARDKVRMVVRYSSDKDFKTYSTVYSAFGRQGVRHTSNMTGLSLNTLYFVRVYTQQRDRMLLSKSYNASSFWTATSAPSSALAATSRERLYLNRFGTGFTQRALRQLRTAGSPEAWLAQQLSPASVPEAAKIADVDTWFAPLWRTPAEKVRHQRRDRQEGVGVRPRPRQLEHPAPDLLRALRARDDDRLLVEPPAHPRRPRPRVGLPLRLRRHDPRARARHLRGPAHRLLAAPGDAVVPRQLEVGEEQAEREPGPRAARAAHRRSECGLHRGDGQGLRRAPLRLHRGLGEDLRCEVRPQRHTTGAVQVLDFTHPNTAADGQAATLAYLRYLAHHPATARRIATKLATYFVSDSPSDGLVDTSPTSTRARAPTSARPDGTLEPPGVPHLPGRKVRTPVADLVATPGCSTSTCSRRSPGAPGQRRELHPRRRPLFSWPRPDGPPLTGGPGRPHRACSPATACTRTWRRLVAQGSGEVPHPRPMAARLLLRFDAYVDHLCRTWLGRRRRAPAQGRHPGGHRPENWAIVTASTTVTASTPWPAGCSRGWSSPCSTPPTT